MKYRRLVSCILIILIVTLIVASVCIGSVKVGIKDIFSCFFKPYSVDSTVLYIIMQMRLPRTLCAVVAGGMLALSGVVFQSIFRNPMADSYILGISSGSSCAVAACIVAGLSVKAHLSIPIISFAGSTITALVLLIVSSFNPFAILLTGLSINYLLSAATTLLIYIGKRKADSVLFWTMGSLASLDWNCLFVILPVCIAVFILCIKSSNAMDIMLLDDSTASSCGINVIEFRIEMLILASIGTSVVVAYCGVIGFIGLMSPHIIRLICGPGHKSLIPLSFLTGSCIMLSSDIIARTVLSPGEIPVGIVTSIVGAPVLFFILRSKR